MRELLDGLNAEHAGRALYGMRRTEERVYRVLVVRVRLEGQQGALHLMEKLLAFSYECLSCLSEFQVHHASSGILLSKSSPRLNSPASASTRALFAVNLSCFPPRPHSWRTSTA